MIPEVNRIYLGDCMETMRSWPDNFVEAVVTDPPYGIRFMGKAWDGADIDVMMETKKRKGTRRTGEKSGNKNHDGRAFAAGTYDLAPEAMLNFQKWTQEWAAQVLRVLKPGGHLLSFSSTRTYHRMASGIEDAGFEIRDQLQWLYGSGFPKSLDVSKAIDKSAGHWRGRAGKVVIEKQVAKGKEYERGEKGTPTTPAQQEWSGWGTALKPANEPICLARKPISESTIAANVMRWGTGAINIDAARIECHDEQLADKFASVQKAGPRENNIYGADNRDRAGAAPHEKGRWPANVIFDQYSAGLLDGKDPGSSRFFYVAKPDTGERNKGLEGETMAQRDSGREVGKPGGDNPRNRGAAAVANFHPTVKPIDLMAYLIQLVTPRGGVCLDPFMGSGTTAIAAARLGFNYLGCEMSDEYLDLAEKRVAAETAQGKFL